MEKPPILLIRFSPSGRGKSVTTRQRRSQGPVLYAAQAAPQLATSPLQSRTLEGQGLPKPFLAEEKCMT